MITKNHTAALAVLLACGFASPARAESPDYSFVDINYSRIMPDKTSLFDDGKGIAVNGSYSLPANFTVVSGLGYAKYDFQYAPPGYDEIVTGYNVGFGYHFPITSNLDLTAEADYLGNHYKVETPAFGDSSSDSHGLQYGIGLRWMVMDSLELHGFVDRSHTNGTNADSHGFKLGGIYDFVSFFGLGLTYERSTSGSGIFSSTTQGFTLFGRFQF